MSNCSLWYMYVGLCSIYMYKGLNTLFSKVSYFLSDCNMKCSFYMNSTPKTASLSNVYIDSDFGYDYNEERLTWHIV